MTIIIRSKSKIENLTRGYLCLPRTFLLLAKDRVLALQELSFYVILGMLMDWDPKHTNTFGTAKLTPKELSAFLNLNGSTIYRQIENLAVRGLVELKGGIIYIHHPERFLKPYADEIKKYKIANLKELLAKERAISANVQEKLAKSRQAKGDRADTNHTETPVKPTLSGNHRGATGDSKDFRGSFKNESNSSDESLTNRELESIARGIGKLRRNKEH